MKKQSKESFTETLQRQISNYIIPAPDITNLESTSVIQSLKKCMRTLLNKPLQ